MTCELYCYFCWFKYKDVVKNTDNTIYRKQPLLFRIYNSWSLLFGPKIVNIKLDQGLPNWSPYGKSGLIGLLTYYLQELCLPHFGQSWVAAMLTLWFTEQKIRIILLFTKKAIITLETVWLSHRLKFTQQEHSLVSVLLWSEAILPMLSYCPVPSASLSSTTFLRKLLRFTLECCC